MAWYVAAAAAAASDLERRIERISENSQKAFSIINISAGR